MSLVRSHSLFPIVHLRTTRRTLRHQPRNDGAESASASSAAGSSTPAVACPPHPHSAFEVVLDEADYLRDPPGLEGLSLHAFRVAEVEIVLTDPSVSIRAHERCPASARDCPAIDASHCAHIDSARRLLHVSTGCRRATCAMQKRVWPSSLHSWSRQQTTKRRRCLQQLRTTPPLQLRFHGSCHAAKSNASWRSSDRGTIAC